MPIYKLTIKPTSLFSTPWQSDTIFGHLCWVIRWKDRESVLENFLKEWSDNPPFVLADGFPEGYLPIPILAPLTFNEKQQLAERLGKSIASTIQLIKKAQAVRYISIEAFNSLQNDLSSFKLYKHLISNNNENPAIKERVIMRTAINRFSFTALENQLYDKQEFYLEKSQNITVWVKILDESFIPQVKDWFEELSRSGYGADLSTGSGQFEVISFVPADSELPKATDPNAFMNLSSYIPKTGDPTDGTYSYRIKRGKLGGLYSVLGTDHSSRPSVWKQPLIMFEPGSVFKTNDLQPFYGRMVDDVYKDSDKIRQCGLSFPLGVRL